MPDVVTSPDPFFDDEILQLHMMEAWQQRGRRALSIIEAGLKGFATPKAVQKAQEDFQYCGLWYQYWLVRGHRADSTAF